VVEIDLNFADAGDPCGAVANPVKTRLSLTGPLVVARDIAHAKIKERLDAGEEMPAYLRDHPVYYAGPAKTPDGLASGSFGPTTAGRMDSYVSLFQARGGSMVMLAKGNRSRQVTESCDEARRLLSRLDRRSGGALGARLHQEGRGARVSQSSAWRRCGRSMCRGLPGVHPVVDDKGNDFFGGRPISPRTPCGRPRPSARSRTSRSAARGWSRV
jgi:fumarate hydratase class I